jgi:hypothetical protein
MGIESIHQDAIQDRGLVDGDWVGARSGVEIEVHDQATHQLSCGL